ncbi:MAG: response regulator transcription factor [Anaerolineae bacterium]|nr:response regulator transcription factor [Anaerolineae bacterium]
MLQLMLVEDHARLREGLAKGLEATGKVKITAQTDSGEQALELCLGGAQVQVILMDVALAGAINGIEAAVAIRREFPRMPVVFYSIQDDDSYYRSFRQAGILSHYAYVRKSNYLLPDMIVPLLEDAVGGRSFIDPDIETRVHEVTQRDQNDPLALLEPNEQTVIRLIGQGLTNEQIAARMGFRDKRTISRTNGEIYAAWGLVDSNTDEKIARTRAIIIYQRGELLRWDAEGALYRLDERGDWIEAVL